MYRREGTRESDAWRGAHGPGRNEASSAGNGARRRWEGGREPRRCV